MDASFLQDEKYNFLDDFQDRLIYLTVGGSHAYNTNVESSDIDLRGIVLEPNEAILGFENFEQYEDNGTDTVLYGLRKAVKLMKDCNPNMIELLGTRTEEVFYCDAFGQALRDNLDLFLSQRAVNSFGGYARSQLRKIENALNNPDQEEKEEQILNSIYGQMDHIEDRYEDLTDHELKLYIDQSNKENRETEIFMDGKFEHYPLRDFKNIHSEMQNVVKSYGKLNHRNNKKTEEQLYKHAMHLVRLLQMGIEVLDDEQLNTYRENSKLLMEIRQGELSFEQIFNLVDHYEEKFEKAKRNTHLPKEPNHKKIDQLVRQMNEMVVTGEYQNFLGSDII